MSKQNTQSIDFSLFQEVSERTVLHSSKWLSFKEINYVDPKGVQRKWELIERNTRQGEFDGVDVVAVVHDSENPQEEKKLLLVKQYRPPMKNVVIEFPAGLVDKGESPKDSALRELKEETGYTGTCTSTSGVLAMEPGLTNANTSFVRINIDLKDNRNPQQELEPEEFLEVLLIPFSKLFATLQSYNQQGLVVDAKLYTFAYGLQFYQDFH